MNYVLRRYIKLFILSLVQPITTHNPKFSSFVVMSAAPENLSDNPSDNVFDVHYGFQKFAEGRMMSKAIKEYVKTSKIDVAYDTCSSRENKTVIIKSLLDYILRQQACIVEHHANSTTKYTADKIKLDFNL